MNIDDRQQYFSYSSDCAGCKHYAGACTCPAFPAGIPVDVLSGDKSHREVISGQASDITFEAI